ncbi:hypothetical protein KC960_01775 [Candidatus Saccharibacteria bacterium]|nr:hypothetical protein [Candidatus Saccharibacteria bacterium]
MKIKNKLLATAIVTGVAVTGGLGLSKVNSAYAMSNGPGNFASDLAQRFNLNQNDVESFLEEKHQEREQQMEQNRTEQLQNLVDSGKLTADQKNALEAKFDEMRTERESLKNQNLTREEMHTKHQELRDSFKSWADSQGIDLSLIRPLGPGGHRHGPGGDDNNH